MKSILRRFMGLVLALALVFSISIPIYAAENWEERLNSEISSAVLERDNSYTRYCIANKSKPLATDDIIINPTSYSSAAPNTALVKIDKFNGCSNVLLWGNSSDYAVWNFTVPNDGMYELKFKYFPLKQASRDIEISVKIDDSYPFYEATSLVLNTAYKSEYPIRQDALGNDYNSAQVEINDWYDEPLRDASGLFDEPYRFYLSAGNHTLSVYLMQETFALGEISFTHVEVPLRYDEYVKNHDENNNVTNYSKFYQAEEYTAKSHSSITPQSNRGSSQNVPFSYSRQKLNVISGENWKDSGQWLEWKVDVPQDGWYTLNFRYSQSYNKNLPIHRRLYIDSNVPFAEVYCFEVPYKENWDIYKFEDETGKEMRFWLTGGSHIIRMEAVLGDIGEIVSTINDVVYDLSYIYQRVIMVVGTSPDANRDYKIEESVPSMINVFEQSSLKLKNLREKLNSLSGGRGTTAGIIDVLSYQLDDMVKKPSTIPMRTETLYSNISSLSSTGEELKSQAMDMDYIIVSSPDAEKPRANDNFIQSLWRSTLTFIYSFVTDYGSFSEDINDEGITVWVNSGRDQAQVLNRIITDMFVPSNGIPVKLKLVDASLMQAFLSGTAPDAMIMTSRGQPVNLAIRGALADLSKMEDFNKVKEEFMPNALLPYMFNGGCYGLPDSQSFFMMFYRKDVFNELGLEAPQTWDDFYDVLRVLQVNNMDAGLPYAGIDAAGAVDGGLSTTSIFSALLLQNGGDYYVEDGTKTALTSSASTTAFKQWTDFYTKYGLPMSYDFYNRFRTGTMPIGIAAYTMYNQIYVAAPEIKNLWAMVPIPGTKKDDGTIDRSQGASGTACVITSTSKNKEKAWKFLRWWTGNEAQTRYSQDIESSIGIAARYPTANKKALSNIHWSRNEYRLLCEQWNEVQEIPEIPGSYYTVRGIDNAFKTVTLNGKLPKETLVKYCRDIDAEITRKRGEFNLDKQ